MIDADRRFCGICGHELVSHMIGGEFETWVHPDGVTGCPMPVPRTSEEIRSSTRCQFCGEDVGAEPWVAPFNELYAEHLAGAGQISEFSGGPMLACPGCAALLTADDWPALQRRVAEAVAERQGVTHPGVLKEMVEYLTPEYRLLKKMIKSPPHPGVPASHRA